MTIRVPLSRRSFRAGTLAALAALACGVAAFPAEAQDGEDGEEGAEGADAPAPTMDDALEQSDPKGVLGVKLPRSWKVLKRDSPDKGELAIFQGLYTTMDAGAVVLSVDGRSSRASLSLWNHIGSGKIDPAAARSGSGWVEGCSVESEGDRPGATFARCIEKDGQVYVVRILCARASFDRVKAMAVQMLDSVKLKGSVPREGLPKGWQVKKAGDFDVWTDSEDLGKATRPATIAGETRAILVKALKGKPFDESRPVMKSFQNAGRFLEETKAIYGEEHQHASWDPFARATMIKLMSSEVNDFPGAVRSNAARQYVVQYFGGDPPPWVSYGIQRYAVVGADSGGKPGEPKKDWVTRGKSAASRGKRNFDSWLGSAGGSDIPDVEGAYDELWAWHFFFRHASGAKKYRKAYDASLDALRATGDALAARKAWDGTDFEALTKDFKDWAEKWEP